MSRFAGAFGIGAGADSSSEEESVGSEENQAEAAQDDKKKISKYFMDSDNEDSEERHFKRGQDKKWEALEKILDTCNSAANVKDFNKMDDNLPKLIGEVAKASQTLFKNNGEQLPNRVLKVLLVFEDTINEVTNAMKKKMGKVTAVSHTKLKQKFKNFGLWLKTEEEAKGF